MIHIKHLSKIYFPNRPNQKIALDDINLDIEIGEFVVIMGPSGSGKTTLLNTIATLDKPSSGSVTIYGENVYTMTESKLNSFRYRTLGYIFQDFNLVKELNVHDNIALPLMLHETPNIEQLVRTVALEFDIENLLDKRIYECSGGQQQRIAAARAMVTAPRLLIADEPTGNLDTKTTQEMMQYIKKFHEKQMTIILVTHNPFVASYADTIYFLDDGKIVSSLKKENKSQRLFYDEIIDYLSKGRE